MLTRVILAAGVAALAIAAPAYADKGGGHGGGGGGGHGNGNGGGGPPAAAQGGGGGGGDHGHGHGGGGGGGAPPAFMGGGGGHGHGGGGGGGFQPQAFSGGGGGGHGHGHGGGGFAPQQQQPQHFERQQARGFERQQLRQQGRGFERQQARTVERQQMRGVERQQARKLERQQARGLDRQQARMAERQQMRENGARAAQQQQALARQQFEQNRFQQAQTAFAARNADQLRANQMRFNDQFANASGRGLIDGCPPGLWAKNNGCMPPGQAAKFLGAPLANVQGFTALSALPQSVSYLYPNTPDYYYQYGDGYLYQVNRNTNLIDNLIPLLAGGYLPGQYLPQPYMASYVPDYYGLNSFYPASYDSGYGYGNVCNRYYSGVIYQVDCSDGFVENVIPMYAQGYGVGQLLPSAYSYYNVPIQYRSMYYDTPDYGYWYSPGAIYQYDPRSSMITSVAALLSPGFTVGQPLPVGYDVYNVPYDYRATYYDTPNAWYRYSNGYIYQVDPVTQVVTALVASLLT